MSKAIDEILENLVEACQYDWSPPSYKATKDVALVKRALSELVDPVGFVEPCEPDCTPERHAYHQGQWDMAVRMSNHLEKLGFDTTIGKDAREGRKGGQ